MNLLLIDDDDTLRALLQTELRRMGHAVTTAATGAEGLAKLADAAPDVVVLDLMLPDMLGTDVLREIRKEDQPPQVVVFTAHGTIDTAIQAMKLGAFEYLQKPCHLKELELVVHRAGELRRLGEENDTLRDALAGSAGVDFVGCGKGFDELRRFIAKVAASDATVLIRGETGTGKELVARTIHQLSGRKEQPFVVVDCAALHESLLQSELFGHEKGAFTGAVRLKHGLFEAADRGTVFLDEIGDVSPAVQAALLRVLESSAFRRLGGTREVRTNVRLVAATNRELERMIADGRFRKDLYFRLNTIHVELPSLRLRPEEISFLAEHFLRRHNERNGTARRLSAEAAGALLGYAWPGNVRELRHALERALVVAEGQVIAVSDLPPEARQRAPARPAAAPAAAPGGIPGSAGEAAEEELLSLAELERRHIERVLLAVGGHRSRAARVLGISERNLYRKLSGPRAEGDAPAEDGDAP